MPMASALVVAASCAARRLVRVIMTTLPLDQLLRLFEARPENANLLQNYCNFVFRVCNPRCARGKVMRIRIRKQPVSPVARKRQRS
jgi:hypothetical protein